jgi:hypothetical protein
LWSVCINIDVLDFIHMHHLLTRYSAASRYFVASPDLTILCPACTLDISRTLDITRPRPTLQHYAPPQPNPD